MALGAYVPPWIGLADPLGSFARGSQIGQGNRRLNMQQAEDDESADEAGDKLRQSDAAMGIQQQQFAQELEQKKAQASAVEALRKAQQEHNDLYRGQMEEDRKAGIARQQKALEDAEKKATSAADALKKTHEDQAGFVSEVGKLGVGPAMMKYPNTPANVFNHYATLEQQKALAEAKPKKDDEITITEETPAVPGTPAAHHIFGADDPAVPATPKIIKRYTTPRSAADALNAASRPDPGDLGNGTSDLVDRNVGKPVPKGTLAVPMPYNMNKPKPGEQLLAPIKVGSKEDRDKLPPGAVYIGPDGKQYTKGQ